MTNGGVTAVSHNSSIITVIFDNEVLGMLPSVADRILRQTLFADRSKRKTDYVKVYGWKGIQSAYLAEFNDVFRWRSDSTVFPVNL